MSARLTKRMRKLADCDSRAGEPLGKCLREAADHIEALERFRRDARATRDVILESRREWQMRARMAEAALREVST